MDGRGRQGSNNSNVPTSAPSSLMSGYGYPGAETNSSGTAYSSRDRFWSTPSSTSTTDPWGSGPYTPQLELSSFSSPTHSSSVNQNYIPYGGHNSQPNGGPPSIHSSTGDLTFSGPSPPNQLQPISVSSSTYPPPSPCRQYTPSSTPSPHIGSHAKQQQNNSQQHPSAINGNGINGNSHHSSASSSSGSPPNNNNNNNHSHPSSRGPSSGGGSFQSYLNENQNPHQQQQHHEPSNGPMQNGHSSSMSSMNKNENVNGMERSTGHPNELPGYLSHPRQSLNNSNRYPGEMKASEGDPMMQQQNLQYQHHYYQNYGGYHNPYYQEAAASGYHRPYDPYQPYSSGGGGGSSSSYPPPPGGEYHSEYNERGGGTSSSSNDPNKPSDLERKMELSPNKDSQQQNQQSKITGNNSSHDPGNNFSSAENHGGRSFGESNLMNLNNTHHPQDSSSCSSQSPSSFDLQYSQQSQQHQQQMGLRGHNTSMNTTTSSPTKMEEHSVNTPTDNNNKRQSPSSDQGTEGGGYKQQQQDDVGQSSFLGVGHPQSPISTSTIQQQPASTNISPKENNNKSKSGRKSSTTGNNNSVSPHSEGGETNNQQNTLTQQQNEDIKPVIPIKDIPVKKKRKKNKANTQIKNNDMNRDNNKEKESNNSDFVRIKEEPKDTLVSDHGKLNKKMSKNSSSSSTTAPSSSALDDDGGMDGMENDMDQGDDCRDDDDKKDKKDVPMVECGCFPADEVHAEPGPFYTHLGAAQNLIELRKIVETRTGFRGNQIRLEKVIYTGKEGKTSHGCPLAKWILRRGSFEEQLLFLVKHRKGHKCTTAWIVVCCVIWEGVPPHFADNLYDTLVYKLNRFGIPTTRRSDTNEQRSCACQGVDPDTCGSAFSFGCAWSMFFNGCKYARSRNVRKFRLTEEHEESELEEKVQHLATHLAPLYERVAQDSYTNQIDHENEGLECRLGYRPGRPFSGVTACLDYCSHAHKDAHNMMNGCTVTVSLTRNRTLSKGDDEQFHVLPLYKLDDTDEHGSKEGQKQKVKKGQLEILKKFPCKVRIRKVPLLPSRRRAKAKSASSSSAKTEPTTAGSMGAPVAAGGINTPLPSPANSSISTLKSPADYNNSDMPPVKREKLFDERLTNGTTSGPGGDPYGENRFHQVYSSALTNQGPLHHPFNPELGSGSTSGASSGLWNHFGTGGQGAGSAPGSRGPGQSLSHHGPMSSQSGNSSGAGSGGGGAPFGSYFDHSFSAANGGSSSGGGGNFGHNNLSNGSSSLSSLTELTNSTSISRHGSSSNLTNLSSSGNSNILSSPGSSGGNPGSASSGYSSMSPILPSFRNTFMTEAESMGMISSISSPGSSQPDSTSSPRSVPHPKSNNSGSCAGANPHPHSSSASSSGTGTGTQSMSTPAFPDHSSPYSSYGSQGYSSVGSSSGPPGGIYHPQPHNPCLPPPHLTSTGISGVPPFSSSSMIGSSSYGTPSSSSFGHHLTPESHYGMSMNPLSTWNPGYSSNYAAAAYGSYPQPMGSIGMGMNSSNFGHPMTQYSPYQNRIPQQQMTNSWGAPTIHPFNPPNMNLNIHHPQHPPQPPPSCFVTPPKPKVIPEVNESFSDNEDCFKDPQMGGVAIALTHGSVILQCAKHEMHATTALKSPNRMYPSRICLIFYQHKSMNNRFHGWSEWEKKIEAKKLQEVKLINQGKMEASPRKMKQLIKEGYIQDNQ